MLPAESPEQRDEQTIATGFLALGVKDVNQRFKVRFVMDNIDEQIDTVSRSLLGLTASCARCHDHKFDPIPTKDYYALAGIFHSTDLCAGGCGTRWGAVGSITTTHRCSCTWGATRSRSRRRPEDRGSEKGRGRGPAEFEAIRGKPEGDEPGPDGRPKRAIARQKMRQLAARIDCPHRSGRHGQPATLGVRDGKTSATPRFVFAARPRSWAHKCREVSLSVVNFPDAPQINPAQSGRLELAQWLDQPQNPLTSRVIVNRVWQHLFGRGLVKSVDNFGVTGDVPTHPELLDHLAGPLRARGLVGQETCSRPSC